MAAEIDPQVPLRIEGMDQQEFASYIAGRQAAIASLPRDVNQYFGRKMLLEQAIEWESKFFLSTNILIINV